MIQHYENMAILILTLAGLFDMNKILHYLHYSTFTMSLSCRTNSMFLCRPTP